MLVPALASAATLAPSVSDARSRSSLVAMPIAEWNYKSQDGSVRHMGPMAQDFRAAYGLGHDELTISTIDSDGVSLAAIQGLHSLLLEQEARIAALEARLARLEHESPTEEGAR